MAQGRVLVVDDEADVRKSVRVMLANAGYDVIEADDGQTAMEAIRSGDNPLMVSAVICDLDMPKVKGMQAIAFFRNQFPGVPVIVLTGKATLQTMRSSFKQGVYDYIEKPVKAAELTEVVAAAVKGGGFKEPFRT